MTLTLKFGDKKEDTNIHSLLRHRVCIFGRYSHKYFRDRIYSRHASRQRSRLVFEVTLALILFSSYIMVTINGTAVVYLTSKNTLFYTFAFFIYV